MDISIWQPAFYLLLANKISDPIDTGSIGRSHSVPVDYTITRKFARVQSYDLRSHYLHAGVANEKCDSVPIAREPITDGLVVRDAVWLDRRRVLRVLPVQRPDVSGVQSKTDADACSD